MSAVRPPVRERDAGSVAALADHADRPATLDDAGRRRRLAWLLLGIGLLAVLAGLVTGSDGFAPLDTWAEAQGDQAGLILGQIRAPRTLGALLVGALLGLGGALAQGLFRNPLADPYLLGSAAGAGLAVVLVLAGAALGGLSISLATAAWLERVGLVVAAFAGALAGVLLTLVLAQGAVQTLRLLLAGVVVSVLLGAVSDLVTVVSPDALRGKQAFMLGSTSFLGWPALALLATGLVLLLALALRHARALDALTLGEDSAASLGLHLGRVRLVLVLLLAASTALAVSQAGLVAFVGLVAPHLVRRHAPGAHAWLLSASAAMGAVLLGVADVVSRAVIPPQELPVGVVTAVLGGLYLFVLLRRRGLG
ncbi:MAG: iron ABC transporter permease [Aquabacterium sp.]|nr:iron ABC transporter permease [Aquabacterium sp.]